MSFILDAIKKSESDRQQKASPDISDVPTAVPSSGAPRSLWVLIGLLALTVLVLLAALLRPAAKIPVPVAATPIETPVVETPALDSQSTQPDQATADNSAVPATAAVSKQSEAQAPSNAAPASPAPKEEPAPQALPPAPIPVEPEPVSTDTYLTYNELVATGRLGLPEMHIDLHVYSNNPAERFVFINMNQYRENATLSEGPKVTEITSDGVLLEYVGTTFLLPRE